MLLAWAISVGQRFENKTKLLLMWHPRLDAKPLSRPPYRSMALSQHGPIAAWPYRSMARTMSASRLCAPRRMPLMLAQKRLQNSAVKKHSHRLQDPWSIHAKLWPHGHKFPYNGYDIIF